ncbi:T9SS type A sorting domain-containing protein [Flavobacterium sp. GT3R68]|uniref:T9SS type A sorting domain-containing protein n=1 Tax=Flavobacterium sp. GT3R68 TaxID=2594437 RepID=UPI0013156A05|nr:T9SS type A sorting domain-containing protein [Flavobacterium sp. GT3R68]
MKKIKIFLFIVPLLYSNVICAQYGTLDNTFGDEGKVITFFGQYESEVHSLAIQPDGKIIAAGSVFDHGGYNQFGLARYNANGTLDSTFGTDGIIISAFLENSLLNCMVLQTDGKIIAGGNVSGVYPNFQSLLVRYNSNGTIDPTFGVAGKVITNSNNISSLVLQPDGKIVCAGISFDGSDRDIQLIRYTKEGMLDAGFGIGGIVTTSIGDRDFGYSAALQTDGKIILSGATSSGSGFTTDYVIARYFESGILDVGFGSNGIVMFDMEDSDVARSVKIQKDEKIVFLGYSKLFRLMSDGNIDTGFGTNGIVTLPLGNEIQIQPDEKIVTVGTYENSLGSSDIALARYESSGDLDSTFGTGGIVTTSLGASSRSGANAVSMQTDGKIIVGGSVSEAFLSSHPHSVILRYNSGLLSNSEFDMQKKHFVAYPNPVNQVVNLDFNLNQSDELSIDLYDSNGRKVANLLKETAFESGKHSQKMELPGTLANGIYFLQISNGINTTNIKIVK